MSLSDLENDFINPFVVRAQLGCSLKHSLRRGRAQATAAAASLPVPPSNNPPSRANPAQAVEYGVQAVLALLLLLSGNWLCGAAHLGLLFYMVHLWAGNKVYVDTTDVFRQLPAQKHQRLVLLAAHVVLFMLVVYRCAGGLPPPLMMLLSFSFSCGNRTRMPR